MAGQTKQANHLQNVKVALAKKYAHLATITSSAPKRTALLNRAKRYRRQADDIAAKQR